MNKNQFVGALLILIGIILLIAFLILYFVSLFRNWWVWLILGIGIALIVIGIVGTTFRTTVFATVPAFSSIVPTSNKQIYQQSFNSSQMDGEDKVYNM